MIVLALLLLQAGNIEQGEKLFRQSCAVGYCHGVGGTASRGPALKDRNFERGYVLKVTRDGIPNTSMPGWKSLMSEPQIEAVVDYVMSISANRGSAAGKPAAASSGAAGRVEARTAPSTAAERGRELFFDAVRGTRCSTCHQAESRGAAVGPKLTPAHGRSLARTLRGNPRKLVRQVRTADGDRFPGLLVDEKDGWVRYYDLTTALPVLRTFAAGEIKVEGNSKWEHRSVIASYSENEIEAVAAYIRQLP